MSSTIFIDEPSNLENWRARCALVAYAEVTIKRHRPKSKVLLTDSQLWGPHSFRCEPPKARTRELVNRAARGRYVKDTVRDETCSAYWE